MFDDSTLHNRHPLAAAHSAHEATGAGSARAALKKKIRHFFTSLLQENIAPAGPRLFRLEVPIEPIDAIPWLHRQSAAIKTFWADRDGGIAMAGAGAADVVSGSAGEPFDAVIDHLRQSLSPRHSHLRYYGGIRFYDPVREDRTWDAFGTYRFIIPQFELIQASGRSALACNILVDRERNLHAQQDALLRDLEQLDFSEQAIRTPAPVLLQRVDIPDHALWNRHIAAALHAFRSTALEKVVLARKSVFTFSEPLDALAILQKLWQVNPQLFYFYFQIDASQAFLGGSPERLYKRTGQQIKSEAIAGTRPRGATPDEDRRLGQELLASEKDRREHQFVVETVQRTLERLCHTVDIDNEISLLKLARVQHLCCRLQGILSSRTSDAAILRALHPTPAVGGSPTDTAIASMRELEPFDRGWYAAPVGWISHDAAEFAVAIRSGLFRGNTLSLFAGAGIVQGSIAEAEWNEVENKISNFLKVLASP